jgi:4-amino-4-deoxy-L-arabinose transferase-like glycosyltransferase
MFMQKYCSMLNQNKLNFPNRIPLKYWITAFILLIIYIANLRFDLFIDAGKYATISKSVFESGDLIHLKVFGEPYDQKPPFFFWLTAFSFKLFGVSNIAFKLPTILFTILGTFATYKLGESLYNRQTGILAAIMLVTSECMLLYNTDTHVDVVLTMCITTGLWQIHKFITSRNRWAYFWGFVFIGFALITKGPLGLAIPVFGVLSHVLITKKYKFLSPLIWLPGLLIIVIIALPALIGLYQQFGTDGLKFFFWTNNMGRISGSYTGDQNDILFCFHTVIYLFLPFSFLLYFGAYKELKTWVAKRFSFSESTEGITMAIAVYLFILSISRSQSPQYLLPVIPLIAIFTAKWTVRAMNNISAQLLKTLTIVQYTATFLLIIGSLLIPVFIFPTKDFSVWIPVFLLAGMAVFYALTSKSPVEKLIHVPIMSILVANCVITLHFFPEVIKYNATPIASRDFNKLASEKATLYLLNNGDYEADFYCKNPAKFIDKQNLTKLSRVEVPWVLSDSVGRIDLLNAYPQAQTVKHYKYRQVSRFNLGFLLPSTRFKELDDMYLVKIKE